MKRYWIQCPNCGLYQIKEKAVMPFLSLEMREKVKNRIERGAQAVVLEFDHECPACSSTGKSTGRVRVLGPLKTANP